MLPALSISTGATQPAVRRPADAVPRLAPVLRAPHMPAQLSLFGRAQPAPAGRPRTD